jgi:guanine deaminase
MEKENAYMKMACDIAERNIDKGGGPFGCIITNAEKTEILGVGSNRVRIQNDPTLHAEIVAIRDACNTLGTYDLSQTYLFTSCEPCPMCFSAIGWARIPAVFYCNTRAEAATAGFDDALLYEEVAKPIEKRTIFTMKQIRTTESHAAFDKWAKKEDRLKY